MSTHILIFPYPAQGHMIPLLDLTHHLSLRGLAITIVVTPKNLPILTPLLSSHPSIQTLVLPFPSHPSIPPGVENVKDLPNGFFTVMMRSMSLLSSPLHSWFKSHPSPPSAIISDIFLGWTHHLAVQIGIPRITFSPSGALAVALTDRLWRDLPTPPNPNDQNVLIPFPKVPNSPIYPWWQLSTVFRSYKPGDPDSEFIRDGMLANIASWGVVFNTFDKLESVYLDYVKKDLGHDRVWAVGPLIPLTGASSVESDQVLCWLDKCPDHSVVYACFGSQLVLTNKQIQELANGLEKSGVRFILSFKQATKGHVEEEYGDIPSGFEQRTAERGLVIRGWAPQVLILRHKAVGSFLTHCGWNSVLEAIVAGVPMLTWPMGADQFANATLLVDQIGMADRVCEGAFTVPDADALARKVAESVSKDRSKRVKAKEFSQAALTAVKEGGSSFRDLDGLAAKLRGIKLESK